MALTRGSISTGARFSTGSSNYDARCRLFDFDALGLAPLTLQGFSYDANGNRNRNRNRLSFTEATSYPYTVTPTNNRRAENTA